MLAAVFLTHIPLGAENVSAELLKSLTISSLKEPVDPSNRYLNDPRAIKLGKALFHDPALSSTKAVSCSTCHIEANAFIDGRTIAMGKRQGLRNTPTLLNVAQQHWFFWDGRKDSLWSQALTPLENPAEQDFTRTEIVHVFKRNQTYQTQYKVIFGNDLKDKALSDLPDRAGPNGNIKALKAWKKLNKQQRNAINRVFTNIGKAIASYVSTLKSQPSRFDNYVTERLASGKSQLLSDSEKRGLELFISQKSGCINCHNSPVFSNKEFHNIGTGIKARDNGRSEVISEVIHDPFNCLGKFSDARPDQCPELKYMNKNKHTLSGSFRTPILRSISKTAPYMHDGRYKTLQEVLNHYAAMDKTRAKETDIPAINLTKQEQKDLIHFLLTL